MTARQLESLVRLAEARARVEMREHVTRQDAIDVVEVMNESLFDKSMDARGFADLTNIEGGKRKRGEGTPKKMLHYTHIYWYTRGLVIILLHALQLHRQATRG